VKVFGCRPLTNDCHTHERSASERPQRGRPLAFRHADLTRIEFGALSAETRSCMDGIIQMQDELLEVIDHCLLARC
jgi:hypothetical protein